MALSYLAVRFRLDAVYSELSPAMKSVLVAAVLKGFEAVADACVQGYGPATQVVMRAFAAAAGAATALFLGLNPGSVYVDATLLGPTEQLQKIGAHIKSLKTLGALRREICQTLQQMEATPTTQGEPWKEPLLLDIVPVSEVTLADSTGIPALLRDSLQAWKNHGMADHARAGAVREMMERQEFINTTACEPQHPEKGDEVRTLDPARARI